MTEDFLQMSFGNFIDYIKNEVYGIQTYVDVFYHTTREMQEQYNGIKNDTVKKLLKLVLVKHNEILLSKFISFTINNENMVCSKIETLIHGIDNVIDNSFNISFDGFLHLNECIYDAINIRNNFNPYSRTDIDFDFESYLTKKLEEITNRKYENTVKNITGDELKEVIKLTFAKLSVAMLQLKRLMERSQTINTSATIAKVMIDLMLTAYVVCKTIIIVE
jgi:hypothetical protein|nr:MAG TPA: hypothetical protein [Caudoviricetes sp.]